MIIAPTTEAETAIAMMAVFDRPPLDEPCSEGSEVADELGPGTVCMEVMVDRLRPDDRAIDPADDGGRDNVGTPLPLSD